MLDAGKTCGYGTTWRQPGRRSPELGLDCCSAVSQPAAVVRHGGSPKVGKGDTNMRDGAEEVVTEEGVYDPALEEDSEIGSPVRYTIASYGADYPVDGLVKRLTRQDVYVPEFQRGFVWTGAQASRFVESLLLGLPVPGIFLFKEPDTNKLVVVDGQQRLRTLQYYYDGILRGKEFALHGVCGDLEGLTYRSLPDEERRRLDDSILHATVFQQDDPSDDRSSIYLIFERLNTGGTPLAPQEIRSCVYRGEFNDLLRELAGHPKWREIYGSPSRRGKDQELILRFIALYEAGDHYERPMKGFLNDFMSANRRPERERLTELREAFDRTVRVAAEHLGARAFRPERNLNAAATDAILVGLARRLASGELHKPEQLRTAAQRLLADDSFQRAVTSATTNAPSVADRLRLATKAFQKVS